VFGSDSAVLPTICGLRPGFDECELRPQLQDADDPCERDHTHRAEMTGFEPRNGRLMQADPVAQALLCYVCGEPAGDNRSPDDRPTPLFGVSGVLDPVPSAHAQG
jgi:hypothetical protein